MKFLVLLPVLPLVAASVIALPKEQLKAKSGKANAKREIFTLSRSESPQNAKFYYRS
jgi:hypothetical protein